MPGKHKMSPKQAKIAKVAAPKNKITGADFKSFCARMKGMKSKLTSSKTSNDPNSRINKSLRAWKC